MQYGKTAIDAIRSKTNDIYVVAGKAGHGEEVDYVPRRDS